MGRLGSSSSQIVRLALRFESGNFGNANQSLTLFRQRVLFRS